MDIDLIEDDSFDSDTAVEAARVQNQATMEAILGASEAARALTRPCLGGIH